MNKLNVAVIGSGISGLSASFFLSQKFNIHLFEKNKILGGHTRTINFRDNSKKSISIDTGFIVFNNKNYPDLSSFFKYLDVDTGDSDMSFSVSSQFPNLEYGGRNLNSLFAQRKNIFSFNFFHLLFEIRRLYKIGKNYSLHNSFDEMTVEEFLINNNFGKKIRDLHIYPIISSIWSTNINDVKSFPLVSFLHFFNNHGLFNLSSRPQWKYVIGGSYRYIEALLKKELFKFNLNSNIKKIIRKNNKIEIIDDQNKIQYFDKIIFATHADQALELLENPSIVEKKILLNFKYTKNIAYLHSDNNYMPKKKIAWSSWNFLQNIDENNKFALTYWMNRLQQINNSLNYFVSINPQHKPKNIIDHTFFEHPIFNIQTLRAQKLLGSIQGKFNTFYCGSYCGFGFHEDGIQSAAFIAKKLQIKLPWERNDNFISRLNY